MLLLSVSRPELVPLFTGLSVRQFAELVTVVQRRSEDAVTDGRPGRQWCLPLADRALLVATYYRTNLTMRQLTPPIEHQPMQIPAGPVLPAGPGSRSRKRPRGIR